MFSCATDYGEGVYTRDADGNEHSDPSVGTVANVSGHVYLKRAKVASE